MPPAAADRVEEELRFHVDARIEELVGRGMRIEEARAQAVREFGDVAALVPAFRAMKADPLATIRAD